MENFSREARFSCPVEQSSFFDDFSSKKVGNFSFLKFCVDYCWQPKKTIDGIILLRHLGLNIVSLNIRLRIVNISLSISNRIFNLVYRLIGNKWLKLDFFILFFPLLFDLNELFAIIEWIVLLFLLLFGVVFYLLVRALFYILFR